MGLIVSGAFRCELSDLAVAHLKIACRRLLLDGRTFVLAVTNTRGGEREIEEVLLGPNQPFYVSNRDIPRNDFDPSVVARLLGMVERGGAMLADFAEPNLDHEAAVELDEVTKKFRRDLDDE